MTKLTALTVEVKVVDLEPVKELLQVLNDNIDFLPIAVIEVLRDIAEGAADVE